MLYNKLETLTGQLGQSLFNLYSVELGTQHQRISLTNSINWLKKMEQLSLLMNQRPHYQQEGGILHIMGMLIM